MSWCQEETSFSCEDFEGSLRFEALDNLRAAVALLEQCPADQTHPLRPACLCVAHGLATLAARVLAHMEWCPTGDKEGVLVPLLVGDNGPTIRIGDQSASDGTQGLPDNDDLCLGTVPVVERELLHGSSFMSGDGTLTSVDDPSIQGSLDGAGGSSSLPPDPPGGVYEFIDIAPGCFAALTPEGTIISWQGVNYIKQPEPDQEVPA